jgi:hypothetical protein
MAGASKPKPGSKVRRVSAQDGAAKGGGINTRKHAAAAAASTVIAPPQPPLLPADAPFRSMIDRVLRGGAT